MTAPQSPPPLWHVLGAGSMGSLAAWRLQQSGARTCRAGREAASRQLVFPDNNTQAVHLEPDPGGPIHALVVSVKAGDTAAALRPLLPRLATDVVIVRLQNGMGTLDDLPLPASARLVHAVTTDGAWRQGDTVQVVAQNQTFAGDGGKAPPAVLVGLEASWPGWQWCTDIEFRQWQKLAINAVINPLTAMFGCRNGELLDNGPRQAAMAALAQELDNLLAQWLPDWPGDSLGLAMQIAEQTAGNTSSMLADVQAGKATEVDYINGHVVRMAERQQLHAPQNRKVIAAVHALEN